MIIKSSDDSRLVRKTTYSNAYDVVLDRDVEIKEGVNYIDLNISVQLLKGVCIQEKRCKVHQYCIDHNIHKYWLFDDDFKSFTTITRTTNDLSLLNNISLDQAFIGFDVSGFAYLLAKDGKYEEYEKIRTGMICSYMGVNVDKCNGISWSNEDLFEDIDFIYRLHDNGIDTYKVPIKASTYYNCNSKKSVVTYNDLYQNTFNKYGDRLKIRVNKDDKLYMTDSLTKIDSVKEGKLWKLTGGDYRKLYELLSKNS